jgi:hypothetical protein
VTRTRFALAGSTLLLISLAACLPLAIAQAPQNVLTYAPPKKVTAKIGGAADGVLSMKLIPGFHVNSNTPSDEFLIAMKLTWNAGPLQAGETVFPKPEMQKYSFSQKELSVFTGDFDIVTKFKASPTATPGLNVMTGKLRYQACNDKMCLTPKTIDVTLPIQIVP